MLQELKEHIENVLLPYSFLGFLGGLALQLNEIRNGVKFKRGLFLANIGLAIWIGYIMGTLIPNNIGDIKYALISLSGFLSRPIISTLEEKGLDIFINNFLGKK